MPLRGREAGMLAGPHAGSPSQVFAVSAAADELAGTGRVSVPLLCLPEAVSYVSLL